MADTDTPPPTAIAALLRKNSEVTGSDNDGETPDPPVLRRKSTFRGLTQSLLSLRRLTRGSLFSSSEAKAEPSKPKIRYENTYKMGPDEAQKFNPCTFEKPLTELLTIHLKNVDYDPKTCSRLACSLSQRVLKKLKDTNVPRYRFVVNTIFGERKEQGFTMASRCIWDASLDNSVTVTYTGTTLFATVVVHAIYLE